MRRYVDTNSHFRVCIEIHLRKKEGKQILEKKDRFLKFCFRSPLLELLLFLLMLSEPQNAKESSHGNKR